MPSAKLERSTPLFIDTNVFDLRRRLEDEKNLHLRALKTAACVRYLLLLDLHNCLHLSPSCARIHQLDLEEIKRKVRNNQYVYSHHAEIERRAEALTFVQRERR